MLCVSTYSAERRKYFLFGTVENMDRLAEAPHLCRVHNLAIKIFVGLGNSLSHLSSCRSSQYSPGGVDLGGFRIMVRVALGYVSHYSTGIVFCYHYQL